MIDRKRNHSGPNLRSRFEGCMLGLALGDALGAPLEGGPAPKNQWKVKFRGHEYRWTDDTQMALDIAESLAANGNIDQDDLALRFAKSFSPDRGYGGGAARLLDMIEKGADWRQANRAVFPDGSFGNGAAMRAPVIGPFYCNKPNEAARAARETAIITHAHQLGIDGAVIIAVAASLATASAAPIEIFEGAAKFSEEREFASRLEVASSWLINKTAPTPAGVVRRLGNGVAAPESCVTALYIALNFLRRPYEEMMLFIAMCGGDVDTIGAMAGGIWGAARGVGALPGEMLARLEQRERLSAAALGMYEKSVNAT